MAEALDVKSESTRGEKNGEKSAVCLVCEKQFDKMELYRCITCHESDQKSSSSEKKQPSFSHYCKACVLSHVRKKHEIVDHKRYTPAVCLDHENLCFLFCSDCKVVFCFECISKHTRHSFVPVSEKAGEVRGTIYEFMGKYDELAKPMMHRAQVVMDSLGNIHKFSSSMTGQNLVATFCDAFERVIRSNENSLIERMSNQRKTQKPNDETHFSKDEIQCLENVAKTSNQNLEHLKNMLKMSDGVCVSNFMDSEKCLETSISDQREELTRHAYLDWSPSLNDIVMDAITNAISLVKIPQIQNVALKEVLLNAEEIETFEKKVD